MLCPYHVCAATTTTMTTSLTSTSLTVLACGPACLYAAATTTPPAYTGDVTNHLPITDAAGYASITGSVSYTSQSITTVSFGFLTYLGGSLDLTSNANLALVNMPVLMHVGGQVSVLFTSTNNALTSVLLPALLHVGTSFVVNNPADYNQALALISIPLLSFIGSNFDVQANSLVTTLSAPALKHIGGFITLAYHNALAAVAFPLLQAAAAMDVENNALLTQLSFPAVTSLSSVNANSNLLSVVSFALLTYTGGDFKVSSESLLTFLDVPKLAVALGVVHVASTHLARLSAPLLTYVSSNLEVSSNAVLTAVSLPAVVTIGGGIAVQTNTALAALQLPALASVGAAETICGNAAALVVAAGVTSAAAGQLCAIQSGGTCPTATQCA